MLTTGKGTHYCTYCGFDMKAREERSCALRDGDFCEPKKYAPLSELGNDHPRVYAARVRFNASGCRHRPHCKNFIRHKRISIR